MIVKIVKFVNGHFYDQKTNQRIEIIDGAELSITAINNFFRLSKTVGNEFIILKSSEELEK